MFLLWILVDFIVLTTAIWVGTQIAQILHSDMWRCATVALVGVVCNVVLKLLLSLLIPSPVAMLIV